jgi:hypothetical protein
VFDSFPKKGSNLKKLMGAPVRIGSWEMTDFLIRSSGGGMNIRSLSDCKVTSLSYELSTGAWTSGECSAEKSESLLRASSYCSLEEFLLITETTALDLASSASVVSVYSIPIVL